jgi:hypoxanthine phosphoribosyltransferase
MNSSELIAVRENAERLFSAAEVDQAMDDIAQAVTARLASSNPILLTVMNGGMFTTSMLLNRLHFPLEVDYIHLSRYGDKTSGGDIRWIKRPPPSIKGRTVLLVDDLLDLGVTLKTAVEACYDARASNVLTAVLLVKTLERPAGLSQTDFFGLTGPNRYVFGCGMDYKNYWRNCRDIFAVRT